MPPFWPLTKVGLIDADAVTATDPFADAQQLAREAAQHTGARVLVIDDLQWADTDTLRVLTHLAAELRHTSTLLITTSRPLAGGRARTWSRAWRSSPDSASPTSRVGELSEAESLEWLGERAAFAAPIHARTGGNPFFVREVISLMGDGDLTRMDGVPPGVQAVVRRRVSQLSPGAQQVLQIASVLGSLFETDVISEVLGGQNVAGVLDRAIDAGLVVAVPSPVPRSATFRFAHVIIGEALAAELNPEQRAFRHAAVAKALFSQHPDDAHAAEIALHAAAGTSLGTAALAVDASTRAARLASAHGAHSEAARHWATVAAMIKGNERLRLDALLVSLASALERADEMGEARTAVVATIDLAHGLGDWPSVGAAAAALNHASIWPNQPYPAVDHELIALLEDALRTMPVVDSPERVLTLGCARHRAHAQCRRLAPRESEPRCGRHGPPPRRSSGDRKGPSPRTFSLKQPEAVEERRRVAAELGALADHHDLGADVTLLAELQIALADLALGDIPAVADRLPRCIALLDLPVGLALRSQLGFFRVSSKSYGVGTARPSTERAGARAVSSHPSCRSRGLRVAQRLTIGHDLGDLAEADLLAANSESAIGFALTLQLYSAVMLFDLGRRDEAIARIPYRSGEVPERPLDYVTVFIDVAAAHVAAELGDAAAVPALLERLEPMAGRWANAGAGRGVTRSRRSHDRTSARDSRRRRCGAGVVRDSGRPARAHRHAGVVGPIAPPSRRLARARRRRLARPSRGSRRHLRPPDRRGTGGPGQGLTRPPRSAKEPSHPPGASSGHANRSHQSRRRQLPPRPPHAAGQRLAARRGHVTPRRPPRSQGPRSVVSRLRRRDPVPSPHRGRAALPGHRARVATYPEIAPKLEGDHADLDVLLDDLTAPRWPRATRASRAARRRAG